MTLNQALTLATLLIEFELESPAVQPPPPSWATELKAAKKTISEVIERPPAGEFFTSPDGVRRGRRRQSI